MSAPLGPASGLARPVLVIGAGLIGTSVALALARRGVPVAVRDVDPVAQRLATTRVADAASRGAGAAPGAAAAPLVVVATPPDHLGLLIGDALRKYPQAVVTDVGSVKEKPLRDARASGADISRYVGGHPMAGSERSGPLAASAELFDGRTWAVTPHDDADPAAVAQVLRLAATCGAVGVELDPADHDRAVALTSHLPHLMAALTAGSLVGARPEQLALSGQGLRDVTRIAAGDPRLWRQIVGANAAVLAGLLGDVEDRLVLLRDALVSADVGRIEALLAEGAAGARKVSGKHGQPAQPVATVTVAIPDSPGELARLFEEVGRLGVNIEDIRIDHDPAREYGLVDVDVAIDAAERLAGDLRERGWAAHR